MTNMSVYTRGHFEKGPTPDDLPIEYTPTGYTALLTTLVGHLTGLDTAMQTKLTAAEVTTLLESILSVFAWKDNCSTAVQYIRSFVEQDPIGDTIDYIKTSAPTGNLAAVGEKCLDTVARLLYTCEDVEGTPTWDAGVALEIGVAFIGTGTDISGDSGTHTPNNVLYYPETEVSPAAFYRVAIEEVDYWYTVAGAWEELTSTAPQGNAATVGEKCFDVATYKVHTCIDNLGTPEWDEGVEIVLGDGVIFLEDGDDTSGESGVYTHTDYIYYRRAEGVQEVEPLTNDVISITSLGNFYRYTGAAWVEFFVISPDELSADELAAIQAAESPSAENEFITRSALDNFAGTYIVHSLGI